MPFAMTFTFSRRAGLALLGCTLLLAGCASSPMPQWRDSNNVGYAPITPAVPVTDTAVPAVAISTAAPTRAALVAAAKAEWDFFGNQQIDMRHDPFSAPL